MKDIRCGTVLVFKKDVTREEAERALETLKDVLDQDYYIDKKPPVHRFEYDHCGPVWYIP